MERPASPATAVKLYIDTDITPRLAQAVRAAGFDAVSAYELGHAHLTDAEHLAFAAVEGRALLSCNARDFTPLFEDYWFAGQAHSGVIVSEQLEFGELLRRVLALCKQVTAADMANNWKNLAEVAEDAPAS